MASMMSFWLITNNSEEYPQVHIHIGQDYSTGSCPEGYGHVDQNQPLKGKGPLMYDCGI